jgi:hypothetical protein
VLGVKSDLKVRVELCFVNDGRRSERLGRVGDIVIVGWLASFAASFLRTIKQPFCNSQYVAIHWPNAPKRENPELAQLATSEM